MTKQLYLICIGCLLLLRAMPQHNGFISLPVARFATGDDAAWSLAAFDDSQWKNINVGTVWQEQGFAGYHGYAWYRIHVVIPSSLKKQALWQDSLRIFLAHVNDVDETYFNEEKIGKTGAFPTDVGGYISKWPAVREYHLSANSKSIRWDKENIIAIKVYDGGGSGGIFMGSSYIDMLEKTDGVSIALSSDSIVYKNGEADVPLIVSNKFNTNVEGILQVTIRDNAARKNITSKKVMLTLKAFDAKQYRFTVPNQSGIVISTAFTQSGSSFATQHVQTLPYILTPAPSAAPRINTAPVVGVHPGSPFLYKIAASGQKPLTYDVKGLPAGLQYDKAAGIISGVIADAGDVHIQITVSNSKGKANQELTIKAGNTLALTPTMGWNSWNCWGINVSAEKVRSSAQALIDKGLVDYGWSYVNIDDGWEAPERATDGSIVTNEKFSDMRALGDWLHTNGLKFGIYSSPGPKTCGGFLGSYQYEQKDAATYASWGVDYLKYDWCSYDNIVGSDTTLAAYIKPYSIMADALKKQPRDMIYSICQYGMKDVWKWGRQVDGQSWRTTEDIEDTWESLTTIGFRQDALFPYAGPGHWNDPDMMIVGQVGWGENLHPSRLTPDEQYTHVSLWCLLSAPLLIGCDLSKLDAFTLNLLTNAEVLAIDQDVLGKQAQRISNNDSMQVWVKELANGDKAIGIFNMGSSYRTVKIKAQDMGVQKGQAVRDLWRQKDMGDMQNEWHTMLAPHGVSFLRVKK